MNRRELLKGLVAAPVVAALPVSTRVSGLHYIGEVAAPSQALLEEAALSQSALEDLITAIRASEANRLSIKPKFLHKGRSRTA